jgi:hypothetical protein
MRSVYIYILYILSGFLPVVGENARVDGDCAEDRVQVGTTTTRHMGTGLTAHTQHDDKRHENGTILRIYCVYIYIYTYV